MRIEQTASIFPAGYHGRGVQRRGMKSTIAEITDVVHDVNDNFLRRQIKNSRRQRPDGQR